MRLQRYLNTKTKTKREHGRPHGTHASDGAPSLEPAYLDTYYLRFYSSQSIQRHRARGREGTCTQPSRLWRPRGSRNCPRPGLDGTSREKISTSAPLALDRALLGRTIAAARFGLTALRRILHRPLERRRGRRFGRRPRVLPRASRPAPVRLRARVLKPAPRGLHYIAVPGLRPAAHTRGQMGGCTWVYTRARARISTSLGQGHDWHARATRGRRLSPELREPVLTRLGHVRLCRLACLSLAALALLA